MKTIVLVRNLATHKVEKVELKTKTENNQYVQLLTVADDYLDYLMQLSDNDRKMVIQTYLDEVRSYK